MESGKIRTTFEKIVEKQKVMYERKNAYYAGINAYGNFERSAKFMEMYPNLDLSDPKVMALMYAWKHVDAIFNFYDKKGSGEIDSEMDVQENLGDAAIYFNIINAMITDSLNDTKK